MDLWEFTPVHGDLAGASLAFALDVETAHRFGSEYVHRAGTNVLLSIVVQFAIVVQCCRVHQLGASVVACVEDASFLL